MRTCKPLPELGGKTLSEKQKSRFAVAHIRSAPGFAITTETGEHWISQDGTNWRRQSLVSLSPAKKIVVPVQDRAEPPFYQQSGLPIFTTIRHLVVAF